MSKAAETRAWVAVDLSALCANYRTIREQCGGGSVLAMVKADGYGVGAARVVAALEPLDPWGYGVATAEEGAALRRLGVERPILVVSPLPPQAVATAASARLIASISDLPSLERWSDAASKERPLEFHVEVDTGMGRAGFDWRETSAWGVGVLARCTDLLRWTGIYTHFHSADVVDAKATRTQWRRFEDCLAQLPIRTAELRTHVANSAAALRWPEYACDLVRPGIFLYGGAAVEPGVPDVPAPEPVVAVRSRVVLVRSAAPGTTAGYGATYAARGWERWATVGIGYGDGLPRALSNRGQALIHGQRVPIIGRISMDMAVVDTTKVPEVSVGDVVTFVGRDGDAEIALDEVARAAGTIAYEILTRLTPRLTRVETAK